jgi:hypothetical protein
MQLSQAIPIGFPNFFAQSARLLDQFSRQFCETA